MSSQTWPCTVLTWSFWTWRVLILLPTTVSCSSSSIILLKLYKNIGFISQYILWHVIQISSYKTVVIFLMPRVKENFWILFQLIWMNWVQFRYLKWEDSIMWLTFMDFHHLSNFLRKGKQINGSCLTCENNMPQTDVHKTQNGRRERGRLELQSGKNTIKHTGIYTCYKHRYTHLVKTKYNTKCFHYWYWVMWVHSVYPAAAGKNYVGCRQDTSSGIIPLKLKC